jgi:hypothetical protein
MSKVRGMAGKGMRAEEGHFLTNVLSGCAVKNCMSVTGGCDEL